MKRLLSQLMISAAAVVLFGATAPLHAQTVERATVPMAFHIGSTLYSAGTYELKLPGSLASPLTIATAEGKNKRFALVQSGLELNDKARERGPVLILKCGSRGCFLTQIWTSSQGYVIGHPRSLDEELASNTHVVALTRVVKH